MNKIRRETISSKAKRYIDKDKLFEIREEMILNVTEDLLLIMEDKNITKKELADRLNKSRAYITQLLSGDRNMTLGTFSDICCAIDVKPEIKLVRTALGVKNEQTRDI